MSAIVPRNVSVEQANWQHGGIYGLDWVYEGEPREGDPVRWLPSLRVRRNPEACNQPPGPEIAA